MSKRLQRVGPVLAVSLLCFLSVPPVGAAVDLELRPGTQGGCPDTSGEPWDPGDPDQLQHVVLVGLYAVHSVPDGMGSLRSLTAILNWDPEVMELVGRYDNGPYNWIFSRFPDDSGFDGINDGCFGSDYNPPQPTGSSCVPYNDGDAWYHAFAQFAPNPPAQATPEGLLITTFRFRLLGPGPGYVSLIAEVSEATQTRVLDGYQPGLIVTGDLGDPSEVLGCAAPIVEAEGCRYLKVTFPTCDTPVALAITADSNEPGVSCVDDMYLQADGSLDGTLLTRQTPDEWGTIHLHGPEIVPDTTYTIEAVCDEAGAVRSTSATVTTWQWGDVDNQAGVELVDVLLVVDGFQGIFTSATPQNVDVYGPGPVCSTGNSAEIDIDLLDILSTLDAFQGRNFATDCGEPCGN